MKEKVISPKKQTREKIFSKIHEEGIGVTFPVLQVFSGMLLFSGKVSQLVDTHFQRYKLSQPGFLTLMFLYSNGEKEWTAIDIATVLEISPPSMTGILDTLEKAGYLQRIASKTDRRKNYIHLSKQGKSKLKKTLHDHISRIHKSFSQLDSLFLKKQDIIFKALELALEDLVKELKK